ncbi:MAG: SH3 domain-containing protein [Treponema sp.]|uniref:SH3 domain-containing protein n=1 Tax=Treponema sp. TaxID=166 RepID=UPI00298E90B0|nr:SH3 domain-containing protein [Treponema sp.]MCR5386375.1 SH3 domain-containing protein [Treponema sp.]
MKMKKIILISSIFAAIASLAFAGGGETACMLRNPGWVYTREGNDLKYKTTIDVGTKIDATYSTFVPAKINNSENKWETEYTKIYYEGDECYTPSSFIGYSSGTVYVVKNDAPVFTTGTIASVEAKCVPVGTVVISLDNDGYSTYPGLVKVIFYDAKIFGRTRSVFMLRDDLSESDDDYTAVILTNAAAQKDVKSSKEQILLLLSEAQSVARSSGISEFVEATKAKILGEDISKSPVEDVNLEGVISSDGAKVNVREAPGKGSNTVGQLEDGTAVSATKKTTKKEKIGGEEASWYYVEASNGTKGWIFGSTASFK